MGDERGREMVEEGFLVGVEGMGGGTKGLRGLEEIGGAEEGSLEEAGGAEVEGGAEAEEGSLASEDAGSLAFFRFSEGFGGFWPVSSETGPLPLRSTGLCLGGGGCDRQFFMMWPSSLQCEQVGGTHG